MALHRSKLTLAALAAALLWGCPKPGPAPSPQLPPGGYPDLPTHPSRTTSKIKYVFVIAMENESAERIYGSAEAPYLNGTLVPAAGRALHYADVLPKEFPSEPHYLWMEAGTNAFGDHTFTNDADPSAANSTAQTAHLATQIRNASNGTSWMSYQEGLSAATGACPVESDDLYAAKHDPFVFFQDVAGNPPSKTNPYCASHHKPLSALASDLSAGTVASYNFITPNLCHDMHGALRCPFGLIRDGDTWLEANLPPLLAFAQAHAGVVFLVWDEPEKSSGIQPFLVLGPNVIPNQANPATFSHSSLLKSIEQILELPVLPTAAAANDFSSFFTPGSYP